VFSVSALVNSDPIVKNQIQRFHSETPLNRFVVKFRKPKETLLSLNLANMCKLT